MIPNSDPLRRMNMPLVPEIKTEIGAALKAARLKKGQSLDAISQQTRIPKKFLSALEENHFEEFPALAYLRGFLKSYCDFLDLDFEAYWRAIQAADAPAPAGPPSPTAKAPAAAAGPKAPVQRPGASAAHGAAPAKTTGHAAPASPPLRAPTPADPAAGITAFLIGVVIAVGLAFCLRHGMPADKASVNVAPLPPSALQPVHQPVQPKLVIVFHEDSWLSLSADGRLLFEGRVPRNSRQEWTDFKSFSLRVPNPGALKLSLNGQPYALAAPDSAGTYRIESP